MVNVGGNVLAAGKIEAKVSGAIPAASALSLTIVVSSPSQPQASLPIQRPVAGAKLLGFQTHFLHHRHEQVA